jgi:N12 class adenine-specific DNA methylase
MVDNNGQQAGREPRRRRLQHVVTLSHKKAVVEWMTISGALDGRKGLIPRTLEAFPEHFRGQYGANFLKASRWWANQDNLLNLVDNANPSPCWQVVKAEIKSTLGVWTQNSAMGHLVIWKDEPGI